MKNLKKGLNPCCNGRRVSARMKRIIYAFVVILVLILVVMEDGLVPTTELAQTFLDNFKVLILVVMEDGLVPGEGKAKKWIFSS